MADSKCRISERWSGHFRATLDINVGRLELQYFIGWICKDLTRTWVVKYLEFNQNLHFIIRVKLTDLVRLSQPHSRSVNKGGLNIEAKSSGRTKYQC